MRTLGNTKSTTAKIEDEQPSWRRGNEVLTHEEVLAKIDSMSQRLADGLVPEDEIEAVTSLRDGMQYGLDILRIREYDSGNSRREAIMAQRERNANA